MLVHTLAIEKRFAVLPYPDASGEPKSVWLIHAIVRHAGTTAGAEKAMRHVGDRRRSRLLTPEHPHSEHRGERNQVRANENRHRRRDAGKAMLNLRIVQHLPRGQRPECRGGHVAHRLLDHREERRARRDEPRRAEAERRGAKLASDRERRPDQQRRRDRDDQEERGVTAIAFNSAISSGRPGPTAEAIAESFATAA